MHAFHRSLISTIRVISVHALAEVEPSTSMPSAAVSFQRFESCLNLCWQRCGWGKREKNSVDVEAIEEKKGRKVEKKKRRNHEEGVESREERLTGEKERERRSTKNTFFNCFINYHNL